MANQPHRRFAHAGEPALRNTSHTHTVRTGTHVVATKSEGHVGERRRRSTAAEWLFTRELFLQMLDLAADGRDRVQKAIVAMTEDHYFFLRLSMAAAKATADAAHGIEWSSMVTAMEIGRAHV